MLQPLKKFLFPASIALLSLAAAPRPSVDAVLDSLDMVRTFRGTAISPDGKRVAWVVRIRARDGGADLSAVDAAEVAAPGTSRRFTAAADARAHRERSPAWSPDGRSLAFLSDAKKERQLQIYVAPAGGGAARQVTSVSGQLSDPKWSPDGRSIAFLFVAGSTQEPGALVAYKPDSGVVEDVVEVQRIAVVDVASGRVREVSPANLYVYDYDWSPDGKAFAAIAAEGSGTNNYWIARLYAVRSDSGAVRELWRPPLQVACPRFSPDGKTIAVIHGIMSDFGSTGGEIYLVPAAGGEPRDATPQIPSSPSALFWRQGGDLVFTENIDGDAGISSLDPATGAVTRLWRGAEAVAGFSIARRAPVTAVVRQSFEHAPEVCAGPIGAWKPVTQENAKAVRYWGAAKSLHWESDGMTIQGWLLSPRDVEPGRKYPLVVSVHGGPSGASGAGWPLRWNAVLPSQGYFVFLPNPRGSFGHGEKFTQGNVKDFGGGDLRDILRGVDEVVQTEPVDPERIGIAGWSYGGYMTMWAVTQTDRFKAAVAGAGIVDWQSYYGQNRIDRWMIPFFGASVYDDPAVYAKSSPITFIRKVKTPTLVLHGDRDSEVPVPQGYEFWHALKTLGVPTQFVVYADEGHGIRKPANQRDIERRVVAWMDRYLAPQR
jgi:dipeptidyl aminopeptidase/acylaminoacyl peptidase